MQAATNLKQTPTNARNISSIFNRFCKPVHSVTWERVSEIRPIKETLETSQMRGVPCFGHEHAGVQIDKP